MTKKTANLPSSRSSSSSSSSSSSAEQIVMQMSSGGFFDNFNLFGSGGASNNNNDDGDNDDKKQENANKPRSNKYFDNQQYQGTNVIDENYPGNTLIFRIKAKSMKIGGLRLWIFLNLMGQLNTPVKKSWKVYQTDENENILEMFYRDTTGAIIVHFEQDIGISVYRFGSSPSMDYTMQESSVLMGILEELDTIVHDGDIQIQDRLLILEEPGDAINRAKELLSFS